jgi:hypothetical protein
MVRTRLGKGEYDDVPESSTHRHGTLCSPMPLASLEQLLAPLNAIVQRLTTIDECQAGQSQYQ